MPKIRHFFCKSLDGALDVATRLQTRGLNVDPICSVCRREPKTICHTLFYCFTAKKVWERSVIPLPSSGLSLNFVFLNIHHLIACTKNRLIASNLRLYIPWILWLIWKARNSWVFEKKHWEPTAIVVRAREEAEIWSRVNQVEDDEVRLELRQQKSPLLWSRSFRGWVKCNVGSSWINAHLNSGASWILRNEQGNTLFHGRRSFSLVDSSLKADFYGLFWVVE